MFLILTMILAPLVTILLLLLAYLRSRTEPTDRASVACVTVVALAIWAGVTWILLMFDFGTIWGLAHARPPRSGPFPEGWPIYAMTAVYGAFGLGLLAFVKKLHKS